jgi:hypothetical protein
MINIRIEGLENVATKLADIPKSFDWVLRNAIKVALAKGRTEIDRAIRARYSVRQAAVLKSIGKPYVSGLWGTIHSMGKRLKPQDFTDMEMTDDHGMEVEYVKGQIAHYKSAFQHGGKSSSILQREGKSRYPIRGIGAPISVPEAMDEQTQVQPRIEKAIEESFYKELDRLIAYTLSTGSVPRSRFSK